MLSRRLSWLIPLTLASIACDPGTDNTGGAGTGGSNSQGAGTNAGAGTTTGGGGSTGSFNTGGGGNSQCGTHCSSDLHSIVDCNNNVVETCPADQGCGATGCVPACDAAKDNKSTIGCDYYAVAPDIIPEGSGACFAAYVANTWGSPVTISLERNGQVLDVTQAARIPSGSGQAITYAPLPGGQLPPGEVAIVFMSRFGGTLTNCPAGVTPAYVATDAAVHGTGKGEAFHLSTSAPVVAYDIYPYGGGPSAATSATLLIPSTAWDTNYVAVNAYSKSQAVIFAQPSMDIVAAEDNTTVTILPKAAIVAGGGVPGGPANVPVSYTLNRGETLQFTQDAELTGSPIQADKPIGIWGGTSCLSVPVAQVACDSAHQQIPPVKALGSEYVGVRYRNRFDGAPEETPPWRLVGAVDGTTLTWDPAPPPGAPTTIGVGQMAEFNASGPFVVKSQDADHPFYMASYMTGCGEVDQSFSDCRGDPEFVNVIPRGQYLDSYVFFTDPTYPETNLVLTRQKVNGVFADVTLDCLGTVTGWTPIGAGGELEFARVDLVRGNFQPQGSCDNGRHEISSDLPFGLTVWGWGSAASGGFLTQAVSYAYPAGASIQPINQVVVPPVPQ